jgi:hypothetical protein
MRLITVSTNSGKNTYDYFSMTGKAGSKAVRRLRRRGRPSYEVAKFPAGGEKLDVVVGGTDAVVKAIKTLLA